MSVVVPPKLKVHVLFDQVVITIICEDGYFAQVLFDDIATALEAGKPFTILSNGGNIRGHNVGKGRV